MGEPNLLTEDQYFKLWAKHNPESEPFNEIQERLFVFAAASGIIVIVAAGFCGFGYMKDGLKMLIFALFLLAASLIFLVWTTRCKHQRFKLWEQWFPYSPDYEFPEDHFKQER